MKPILALALCALAAPVQAAPPIVVAGSLRSASTSGTATLLSLPALSVGGAVDRTLVACVVERASSTRHATSLQWGSTPLTRVATSEHNQSSGFVRVEAWALPVPLSGSGDLVVTTDFGATLSLAALVVAGTTGLDRIVERPSIPPAPPGYSYSTSLALTDTGADSLLLDCAGVGNNFVATASAAGQTAILSQIAPDHRLQMSTRVGPGALGWSVTTDTTRWGQVLLEWPSASGSSCNFDCSSNAFAPSDGTLDPHMTCDGTADDLPPLLAAIRIHGTSTLRRNSIKIPDRPCRVTDTVTQRRAVADCAIGANNCWATNVGLYGSGASSEIRLADGAAGYGTGSSKPLVLQASFIDPNDPTSWRLNGGGARAFNNQIFDLELSTGSGNPGAVGVDAIANNFGRITRSTIASEDNQGVAAIRALRYGQGPALWDHLTLRGYDRCIDLGEFDYSMTAVAIDCTYNIEGIRVTSNALVLRGLTSTGPSPALRNVNSDGLVVLLDSMLTCAGSCGGPAIANAGRLFARNVTCVGFAGCLAAGDGGHVTEYSSSGPFSAFMADARASLDLPIEEPPRARNPANHALRAHCAVYGASPSDTLDDANGIRTAISTGRPVVYCPAPLTTGGHGYKIGSPILIPASVEVLDGLGSSLGPPAGAAPACVFQVAENSTKPLVIRRWWSSGWAAGTPIVCRPAGITRTVVVEDVAGKLFRFDGPGKVFLVDVAGLFEVHGGADVQVDQIDTEEDPPVGGAFIVNDASKVAIRGWKTERAKAGTLTTNGGCTEILGGLVYPQGTPTEPLHRVIDASLFAVHAETAYTSGLTYPVIVRETRAGVTQDLLASAMPGRGLAVAVFASAHAGGCPL